MNAFYFFLASIAVCLGVSNGLGASGLRLEPDHFDLGLVPTNTEEIVLKAKVFTDSEKGVEIGDIKASCGCTEATLSSWKIAKDSPADLWVVINLAGKTGNQNVQVALIANDKKTSSQIQIRGNVSAAIGSTPSKTVFDDSVAKAGETRKVTLSLGHYKDRFKLSEVKYDKDFISAEVRKSESGIELMIVANPKAIMPGYTSIECVFDPTEKQEGIDIKSFSVFHPVEFRDSNNLKIVPGALTAKISADSKLKFLVTNYPKNLKTAISSRANGQTLRTKFREVNAESGVLEVFMDEKAYLAAQAQKGITILFGSIEREILILDGN